MRLAKICCAAASVAAFLAFPAAAQTPARTLTRFQSAEEVQLRDVVGFVRVIPENRSDVAVGWTNGENAPAPQYRVSRRRLIVNGQLRRQIRGCRVVGENGLEVQTARRRLSGDELPVIELRVPQRAVVSASGAFRMDFRAAQSARIQLSGCGDAKVARVDDEAEISVSGSQDLTLNEAGEATISVAGAGDVALGAIHDGLTLSIAGAGDVTAERVDGPTSITVQGAGDVRIEDGNATTLSVVIAGGGDVIHGGEARSLDAVILGGGDVRVHHVDGEINRRVLGGGEIIVGR